MAANDLNPGLTPEQFQAANQFASGQIQPQALTPEQQAGLMNQQEAPAGTSGVTDIINRSFQQQAAPIVQQPSPEQAYIDAQKAGLIQPTEIGPQGVQALMPGINQPINVGGYSGSLIGSSNIFVPTGGVYGFDVDLAKRQKEEEARIAQQQAAAQVGSKWQPLVPQELKDKRFQQSVVSEATQIQNQFLKDISDIYGEDYRYVLENPMQFKEGREYTQKMAALDLLVSRGNQITDELAAMRESIDKGEKVYSDETLKMLNEYENLLGNFAAGDKNALLDLQDKLGKIEGGKALDEYLNSKGVLSQVQGQILGGTGIKPADFGGYATLTTSDKELFDKNIDNLVESWIGPNGAFRAEYMQGLVTPESMKKHLRGYLQDKVKRTTKMQDVSGGGGKKITKDEVSGLIGSGDVQTFTTEGGGSFGIQSDMQFKMPTVKHRVSAAGLTQIRPDGKMVPIDDVQDLQIVSIERSGQPTALGSEGGEDFFGLKPGTVYAVATYDKQVPELKEDKGKMVPTGKMITEKVSVPILADDAFVDAVETDSEKMNVEQGVFTEAVNSMKTSGSNVDLNSMTEEEKINYYINL